MTLAELLLERENDRLVARVTQLTEELVRLKGGDAEAVQLERENLRQLLERRNQALFGSSSEKAPKRDDTTPRARVPQKGHGPTAQVPLPVQDVVVSLEEPGEACCPKCGLGLCEIPGQFETSEEVMVIERRFVLRRIRRKKYRCRCNGHIETAPAPPKLKPEARYSVDFALAVAIDEFVDHIPRVRRRCVPDPRRSFQGGGPDPAARLRGSRRRQAAHLRTIVARALESPGSVTLPVDLRATNRGPVLHRVSGLCRRGVR